MSKPKRKREFSTCRNTKHGRALGGYRNAKAQSHPGPNVFDEKTLVCSESFRIKLGRILVESKRLVGRAVNGNNQSRGHIGCFKRPCPLRDHLTITSEH